MKWRAKYPWESPGFAISALVLPEFGDFPMMGGLREGLRAHAEKRGLRQDG